VEFKECFDAHVEVVIDDVRVNFIDQFRLLVKEHCENGNPAATAAALAVPAAADETLVVSIRFDNEQIYS
jgi:hypothetical protein